MLNRRNFLSLSALATGALTVASAQSSSGTDCASLPEPIASLKSRAGEAIPITTEERSQRIERARELMSQNKLDAIFMIGGTSLVYFTGVRWWNSERLGAMVLPAKGDAFFVCPAFEEDRLREQLTNAPGGNRTKVVTWQEDEDPYRLVAEGLRGAGIASGTLGMEERTTQVFVEGTAKAAPQVKIASATPVTAGCRMIKSAHELALMKLANQVTLQAYEAAWKSLKPGMTQNEFQHLVEAAHLKLGFTGSASVQVGEYSAVPHGSLQPQVIREGAILLMDGGCSCEGYESDISRTFVMGKPTDKMKRVFDIVHQAQSAALKAARPGVEAQSVDAAARNLIAAAGYGPGFKYFGHRVGHGIGMDGHEWPYLVGGDTIKLAPNMCFSDEPGIYIRGEFGVRLEDDMHITDNGAALFTPQSLSLEQPFATA